MIRKNDIVFELEFAQFGFKSEKGRNSYVFFFFFFFFFFFSEFTFLVITYFLNIYAKYNLDQFIGHVITKTLV